MWLDLPCGRSEEERVTKLGLLRTVVAGLSVVLSGPAAQAQQPPPAAQASGGRSDDAGPSEKEADPIEQPTRIELSAFVDGCYAYNANEPADHANFFPGAGTSAKRDDELSLNLAEIDLVIPAKPVGLHLSLGFGNATEVVHAGEVSGAATGPDVWRNVVQASLQWQTKLGRGLLLEAGIFPSHIGMESFQTHLNWNYTRSWLGELSPYYQTGLKLAYPLSEHWSAQVHLLNGWQMIGDVNRGKTLGAQLAYSGSRLSVSLNGIAGPELPDDNEQIRALGDVVATWKATKSLSLGVSADAAREGRPTGPDAAWKGIGLYARFAPPHSPTAFAVRTESYDDADGAISGIAQKLKELTATLEHRPVQHLILKLEGRYDKSSALAFAGDRPGPDGTPVRKRDQFLVLLGAVATF
jgi:Putative beta-barrel porin-2, OmpL-like. bbp2